MSSSESNPRRETAAESFHRKSEAYRTSKIHREGEDLDQVVEWAAVCERVVDVATGAGHVAGGLLQAGVSFVLVMDPAPGMLQIALNDYPDLLGVHATAERFPIAEATLDGVTCRLAAHHFADPQRFLAESKRVLARGGTLALVDNVAPEQSELDRFINRVERLRDPTHVRLYRETQWKAWSREVGLDVEESRVIRRRLDYETWIRNQDPPSGVEERIRSRFVGAGDRIRNEFRIRLAQGRVISFALPTLMLRARA